MMMNFTSSDLRQSIPVTLDVPVTSSSSRSRSDSNTSSTASRRRRDDNNDVIIHRGAGGGGGGMTDSAETLFKEWDMVDMRPIRTIEMDSRPSSRSDPLSPCLPADDTADDSSDLLSRTAMSGCARLRPLYVDVENTSAGGSRRLFRVEFDAEEYRSENIAARISAGRKLIVRGEREEVGAENGRHSATTFCRRITLPDDVDIGRLTCHLVSGKILIEAPTLLRSTAISPKSDDRRRIDSPGLASILPTGGQFSSQGSYRSPARSENSYELLNVASIQNSENIPGGCFLSLSVEVGSLFGPDDVLVKLKSRSKLTVTAERREESPGVSRLLANLLREFDLPIEIDPQSLSAELTPNGVLRVTASPYIQDQLL